MINVLLSQTKGVAVFSEGGKLHIATIRNPSEALETNEQSAARLMAGVSDLEVLSVCDREALRKHLVIRSEREELLNAVLLMLDGTRSQNLRRKAANFVATRPRNGSWIWVENVLLSTPAPDSADAQGAARLDEGLGDFFRALSSAQQQVSLVRTAWHAIPDAAFVLDSREQANARVVSKGVFRALVTGRAGRRSSPFSPAIEEYARALAASVIGDRRHTLPAMALAKHDIFSRGERSSVWNIAPWRSAWLATEWVEIDAKLACDAAAEWQTALPALGKDRGRSSKLQAQLLRLCDDWDHVRHRSSVSPSVDFIHQLMRYSERHIPSKTVFERLPTATSSQHLIKKPALQNRVQHYLDPAVGVSEIELLDIVRVFFDAESIEVSEDIRSRLPSPNNKYNIDSDRLRAVAYCVQFGRDSLAPMLGRPDTATNQREKSQLHREFDFARWENVVKLALSTFSLDERFRKGGFLVLIQGYTPASKSANWNKHAVLLNLNSRKSQFLSGNIATIVQRLQRRLIADLSSGLPVESCGWLPIKDLAKRIGVSNRSLIRKISDFERQLVASGFDRDSVQIDDQNIRLNPDMVATSSTTRVNSPAHLMGTAPNS